MPPKQIRLDILWGLPTAQVSDEQVAQAALIPAAPSKGTKREYFETQFAQEIGKEFVPNGSKDKFGNLRKNIGGRPKMLVASPVKFKAQSSNRRQAGRRARMEFSAPEKLQMLQRVKDIEKAVEVQFSSEPKEVQDMEAMKIIKREMPSLLKRKKVQQLKDMEAKIKQIIHVRRLSKNIRSSQPKQVEYGFLKVGVGMRAAGAGRKNILVNIWEHVKIWHTCERLMGVQVDTQDIYIKFNDLCFKEIYIQKKQKKTKKHKKKQKQKEIQLLTHLRDKGVLPADKKIYLAALESRLQKLEDNKKYQQMYIQRLMQFGNMQVGRPSRLTPLTLNQEKIGWQITHRSWDYAIWLAGLGTSEDLRGHVALPQQFIDHREKVVLVMSDQVPVWLKIGQRKIVFAQHEVVKHSRQSKKFQEGVHRIRKAQDVQETQIPKIVEELVEQRVQDGMTQTRSGAHGGSGSDDKFRVTLECRHAVLGYFAGKPQSTQIPPILIVYGVHCRLANISKSRTWVQDEEFVVGDQVITRHAGDKVPGGIMESWVSLREQHPQIFKDIVIMQQPSATADEIIVGWGLEDLGQRFPAAVLQRDLVSGALSDRARLGAYLQNILCCWIAPQMTPVVQVTDTDFAYPIKRKIDQEKMKIAQEFKNAALKEGREVSFKMGPWELVKVLWRALQERNKQNKTTKKKRSRSSTRRRTTSSSH